jgi:hypothetical protein
MDPVIKHGYAGLILFFCLFTPDDKIISNGVMTFAKIEVDTFTNIYIYTYFRQVGENALQKRIKVYCIPVIRKFCLVLPVSNRLCQMKFPIVLCR